MTIQIERIVRRNVRTTGRRCSEQQCAAAATWFLIDRDMPAAHAANMGERACCTNHIETTYLLLRGAQVVAQTSSAARLNPLRREVDRRLSPRPSPRVKIALEA